MPLWQTGAARICAKLEHLAVEHVFGVPGTQNIAFLEALRRSSLRTVVPTHELAAAFMACGYYRSSGKIGVLTTIPGPGFAFTLAGLAEAAQDSAGVVYLLAKPQLDRKFDLQGLDQAAMLRPLTRKIVDLESSGAIDAKLEEAFAAASSNEPGPVVVHYRPEIMHADATASAVQQQSPEPDGADHGDISDAVERLIAARKPVLLVGQGCNEFSAKLRLLCGLADPVVIPTRSGRGVVSDFDPRCLVVGQNGTGAAAINRVLEHSDCVVAIGCKLSHNGSYGFRLRIPAERFIHVDSSRETLAANYKASLAVRADAGVFLDAILAKSSRVQKSAWIKTDIDTARQDGSVGSNPEPIVGGGSASAFFAKLRHVLPDNGILVTDSGQHQNLATRHFRVATARGLLIPSDFQSMGFGLPAALAAKLANPHRAVVALIGDGGFLMNGMEIATAVRERIALSIIVFRDNALGQIKAQQEATFGREHGTGLHMPDLRMFAESLGVRYENAQGNWSALSSAIAHEGVSLVEVEVAASTRVRLERLKGLARNLIRESAAAARRLH